MDSACWEPGQGGNAAAITSKLGVFRVAEERSQEEKQVLRETAT